ncbi:MAG: type III-B CRISPR-associated protein Cas10/Cmr2, partial [Alphaproteobacteria bacterium]|nr:type III-B CRISPR-associated protein Cas10/Cmr2 [Alphaproteobacteria bacterium]
MTDTGERVLHFTLGPVQGFVAQARRTRDLWAGSFLLSWLAGQAMHALVSGGHGTIAFPIVDDDPLFQAIKGQKAGNPVIGSLPNRFKARIIDPSCSPGDVCATAIREAWRRVANAVWTEFVGKAAVDSGNETRAIWNRQIDNFWEMAWVIGGDGDAGGDAAWLTRRKNWRTELPPCEPGDHCMLMSDRQELSGWVRTCGASHRTRQDAFWAAIRNTVVAYVYKGRNDQAKTLELGASKRLCAIALVKRLFPLLPETTLKSVIGWVPDKDEQIKPDLTDRPGTLRLWPSTAYMAAVPWIELAVTTDRQACDAYAKQVGRRETSSGILIHAERDTRVKHLIQFGRFARIDGGLFFADAIEGEDFLANTQKKQQTEDLKRLQDRVAKTLEHEGGGRRRHKAREASPFYAVLQMDGDSVGKLLQTIGEANVSQALSMFTASVQYLVDRHKGVVIYAGGDDVVALLPLPTALPCAAALADAYRNAFVEIRGQRQTISAAVVFAHYKVPFSAVIRDSHTFLDEVAKDRNGRDSLAVKVWKSSGPAIEWVSGWSGSDMLATAGAVKAMMDLAVVYAKDDEQSTSFLYNITA